MCANATNGAVAIVSEAGMPAIAVHAQYALEGDKHLGTIS